MKRSYFFALIMLLLFPSFPVPALDAEEGPAVRELLSRLGGKTAAFTTLKTDFTQEKRLALFQDAIVLKGRVYLEKPRKIAWHVDDPIRYSVVITDKLIRQWDAETNKVQEVSLTKNPVFQSVLGQITVWFAGDYAAILKDHDVRVLQNKPVVLECTPKAKSVTSKVIKSIMLTFRGDQTYVRTIRILEHSGDETIINFVNTVLNAPLDKGSFEVNPVRKRSSRTTDDHIRLSLNAVDRNTETMLLSDGVQGYV